MAKNRRLNARGIFPYTGILAYWHTGILAYWHTGTFYPEGILFDPQGKAKFMIPKKPTVALRATIEFMKSWCSETENLPDFRAVLDYGAVFTNTGIGLHDRKIQ